MNFLVHDEEGRIVQSNKLSVWKRDPFNGRDQNHTDLLHDLGQTFTMVDSPQPLNPAKVFVDSRRLPRTRPTMQCVLRSKTVNVKDPAVIDNIPRKVRVTVRARSFTEPLAQMVVDKGPLEIELPTPGIYVVLLERFPYIDWSCEVEVVS